MSTTEPNLQSWIGRSEAVHDTIGATPVRALNATLDHPESPAPVGTALPPLWHWLYFLPVHRQSEIGPDGHARRGGFPSTATASTTTAGKSPRSKAIRA